MDPPGKAPMTTIGWTTKGDDLVTIEAANATVLDGMLAAQDAVGYSVSWVELSQTVAKGILTNGSGQRVIVVDVDNANVQDAVAAAVWVNE